MSTQTDDTSGNLKLAQQKFREGRFAEAIGLFEEILAADPNNIKAHRGIAAAYFQSGEAKRAIEHYQRLTTLDMRTGTAWLNLGAIYITLGEFQQAINAVRKGMVKERRSATGFFYLAEAHAGLGQTSMALSGYKEALNIDPKILDAHIGLGNLYVSQKNFKMAETSFRKALEVNPDSRRAQEGLLKTRAELSDSHDAEKPFGRLVDTETAGLKGNVVLNRDLSEEERIMDRQTVRALATSLLTTTEETLQQITGDLEQSVLGMNRSLAEGGDSPQHLIESFRKFQESLKSSQEMRQKLRRRILEIRGHEEVINTPDLEFNFDVNSEEE